MSVCKTCAAYGVDFPKCLCVNNPELRNYYSQKETDPADNWQYGWEPKLSTDYWFVSGTGDVKKEIYQADKWDKFRISIGNCFPDSLRGKLLAEAWARYAPEVMKGIVDVNSAAMRWRQSDMNMTIEEAEAAAGGEA